MIRAGLVATIVLLVGCKQDPAWESTAVDLPYRVELPPGAPPLPDDPDGLTHAKVELGRALFFDQRLSMDRGVSCASCHLPGRAFSDTVAVSPGVGGALGRRNAPSLGNVVYHALLNRDGGVPTLHQQVLVPLTDAAELDADVPRLLEQLQADPELRSLAFKGYGRELDLYVLTRALAAFQRTLISGWSRYDRFLQGDASALNAQEQEGLRLFREVGCASCHTGFDLSDHAFHNVGLRMDHSADPGRQAITLDPGDRGSFKTPTLRNVQLTAPYMHDGSLPTLQAVVEHFDGGGVPDPLKSPLLRPLGLSPEERAALVAFLHSLTDERPLDSSR